MEYNPAILKAEFLRAFGAGGKVSVFEAPARINIIGEHIDYNGGLVFPCAIDKKIFIAVRLRSDSLIHYMDLRFSEKYEFDLKEKKLPISSAGGYANYLNGALNVLGLSLEQGFDVLIGSNIPAGGGVSSSSALEECFLCAINDLFCLGKSPTELALLGQRCENEELHMNCGIMDQYIIANAKKGFATLLDCATLKAQYIPLKLGDYTFVVMNTKKPRELDHSPYNARRRECEEALRMLGRDVPSLCSLTEEQFAARKSLLTDGVLLCRTRHCVTEMARVKKAVEALRNDDLATLGRLMSASHESLKKDYEATGRELDTMVSAALSQKGVLGARVTGAGFGGCAIALVEKARVEEFTKKVGAQYEKAVGYKGEFFSCTTADGARRVGEEEWGGEE